MHPLPFPVLALLDRETLGPRLEEAAAACVAGGLPWLCLRAPRAGAEERLRLGLALRDLGPRAVLTVHGDPAACRALGAAGLHLPSGFGAVAAVRGELPSVLLGVSCHGASELEAVERAGADYALLSPFFAPTSKAPLSPVLGPEGFRAAVQGRRMPVLALGGLTPERLAAAAGAGAAGAAVLGGLFLAPDIESRARRYREEALRCWSPPGVPRPGRVASPPPLPGANPP